MNRKELLSAAILAALASEGAQYDRATLNAMLDKVARDKPVKAISVPMATCYVMAPPSREYCRHVCPQCGACTYYACSEYLGRLEWFLASAKELRGLGLDITLDESAFCSSCAKEPKPATTDLPVQGTLKKTGETVEIVGRSFDNGFLIKPADAGTAWVSAKYIDAKGKILGCGVNVRVKPSTDAEILVALSSGSVERLPARPGDDPAWVRVKNDWYTVTKFAADEITVTKTAPMVSEVPAAYWVINGKRTKAERNDCYILSAFLKKQKRIDDHARRGKSEPIQTALPRLRELLGTEGK